MDSFIWLGDCTHIALTYSIRFLMRRLHCEIYLWVVLRERAERLIRLEWLAYNCCGSSDGEKK